MDVGRLVAWAGRLRELGILAVLIVLVVLVGARVPRFLGVDNLEQILLSVAILAIAAVGETLVILTRNVDLSIDAVIGLSAFVVGDLLKEHLTTVPEAVIIGIALGALLGAFNGFVVTVGEVPAIVATLGTMSIYRGVDFLVARGTQVSSYDVPESYLKLVTRSILGVPALIVYAVLIVAVVGYLLRHARPGRQLYAVGSNPAAAKLVGIPSGRLIFGAFLLSGTLGGLAGVLWGSRFGTINAYAADGMVLEVVAAVVVGGVNIFGGSGTVFGAALGAVLLGTIDNALTLLLISQFWLQAIDGAVILTAVGIDAAITRRLAKALTLARGR